jgi:aryl-alcohol dehydrogenase-like predicted oxidoreductase
MTTRTTRRTFLQQTAGATTVAAVAERVLASTAGATSTGIPTRELGRTGERVSILCLGGWHAGAVEEEAEAIRLVHAAIDEGVTFMDNAWEYHQGRSEEVMGKALAQDGYRKKAFLMTKNCARDHEGSKKHLEDSLRRLRTDVIDLWQFHEIIYDNDPDWIFEKGAMKAALEAQKEGKVRYIGFTGHKDPRIHLRMLDKPFDWDTAQMPINVADASYRSFQHDVVPVCLKKGVAVLGMKGLGGGGGGGGVFTTRTDLTPAECYRYSLSLPVASQVVGLTSLDQLEQALAVARSFEPMTETERAALVARVAPEAADGRHELFKSTQAFDGPIHRSQHGFPERRRS